MEVLASLILKMPLIIILASIYILKNDYDNNMAENLNPAKFEKSNIWNFSDQKVIWMDSKVVFV